MARYRRGRRSRSRSYFFKSRGGGRKGGGWKTMLAPLIGGAGDAFLAGKLPVNGLASAGAGFFLGDQTTRQIGLYQIGYSGANMFLGGAGSGGGAWY